MSKGIAGLDSWNVDAALGVPVFRLYQNLSHLLLARVSWIFGITNLALLLHFTVGLAVLLQPVFFYWAARELGESRALGLIAALLSLCVSASRDSLGHHFESYVATGSGLIAQAFAIGPLLVCLVKGARLTGWIGEEKTRQEKISLGVQCGLWFGLTFLLHHFFGYMALLTTLCFAITNNWRQPVKFLAQAAPWVACGIFLLIVSYQLLSILQDRSMAYHTVIELPEIWVGYGFPGVVKILWTGRFLDDGRLPVLGLMALLGIAAAARKNGFRRGFGFGSFPRNQSFLPVRKNNVGRAGCFAPGSRAGTCSPLFDTVSAGVDFLGGARVHLPRWWLVKLWLPKYASYAVALFFFIGFGTMISERARFLLRNAGELALQAGQNVYLEPDLISQNH